MRCGSAGTAEALRDVLAHGRGVHAGDAIDVCRRLGPRPQVEDACPGDIRRHQVWRKLNALKFTGHRPRQGFYQKRFPYARNAFDQGVPASEQRQALRLMIMAKGIPTFPTPPIVKAHLNPWSGTPALLQRAR